MGAPMAANLAKAGFPLTLFNRTPKDLPGIRVPVAPSAAAASAGADLVVTMLSDDAAEEDVLFGAGGLAHALRPGQVLVNMGTVSPKLARSVAERLEKQGVAVLDAPVSGSVKQATEGTLVILVITSYSIHYTKLYEVGDYTHLSARRKGRLTRGGVMLLLTAVSQSWFLNRLEE